MAPHAFQDAGQPAQLDQSQCTPQFVHADAHAKGLEERSFTGRYAFDVSFESRVVVAYGPPEDLFVVGGDHATFTRGEVLVVLQADGAHGSHRSYGAAGYACARGLGAVLQDGDPVPFGDLGDSGHVGNRSGHVYGDDCLRSGRDVPFDVAGIEVEGLVDIGQYGHGPEVHDGIDVGDPHEGGHDHFGARAHVERGERHGQGRASAVGGQGETGTDVTGVRRFEPVDLAQRLDAIIPEGRSGLDDFNGGPFLFLTVHRSTWNQGRPFCGTYRNTAVDCQRFRHGHPASKIKSSWFRIWFNRDSGL